RAERAARHAPPPGSPLAPLRALFLGRLDAQKGLDRLAAIIAAAGGPAVTWRVLGRAVMADGPALLPGFAVEPPVRAAEDLDALYAWADVLVLPSRFEGVPLVVLEAQRMGCVPLATDVGALGEAVAHGEDGLLVPGTLPEEAIIAGFVDALRALAADRARLLALGERAAARAGALEWDVTMRPWLDRLDALVPLPGAEAAPVQARPAAA
ncbi:glycosyltransferase, partial [Paracraurococcus ruber]|uniref:glycosyltransferase family 4 protein n=1 Tax=Paracraurococcus ruber TaxID=77675 RepID=UPI0010576440